MGGMWESMRRLDDDTLELGESIAESLWWENNIYRQMGNVLLWHREVWAVSNV